MSTPLVVSVHTIVSFDFTIGIVPGWHSTIFPPYFVAGAIYAGFAMVLTLMIPLRKFYGFEALITMRHIDNMAKVMLATGMLVTYGYIMETFMAYYGANKYEGFMMTNRLVGPYAPFYMALLFCNCMIPLILWVRPLRLNLYWLWCVAMVVNVGMWLERFVIVVMSLHRDFVPAAWGMYYPTVWDWATYIGTIGLFLTFIFLFVRFLPALAMSEMKELVHIVNEPDGHHHPDRRCRRAEHSHEHAHPRTHRRGRDRGLRPARRVRHPEELLAAAKRDGRRATRRSTPTRRSRSTGSTRPSAPRRSSPG